MKRKGRFYVDSRLPWLCLTILSILCPDPAKGADKQIVNIDSTVNDQSHPVTLTLDAGTSLRVNRVNSESNGQADLAVSITAQPDPVVAGNVLTYSLAVTNNGPDTASQVVLSDTLPGNALVLDTPACAQSEGGMECSLGDIPPGTRVERAIRVQTGQTGQAVNTASVSAPENDPNPANNSGTLTTAITDPLPRGNLAVIVRPKPRALKQGKKLTYRLIARNKGSTQHRSWPSHRVRFSACA